MHNSSSYAVKIKLSRVKLFVKRKFIHFTIIFIKYTVFDIETIILEDSDV